MGTGHQGHTIIGHVYQTCTESHYATREYGPLAGDSPDISDTDYGFDTCDGTGHDTDLCRLCGGDHDRIDPETTPCEPGEEYGLSTIRATVWDEYVATFRRPLPTHSGEEIHIRGQMFAYLRVLYLIDRPVGMSQDNYAELIGEAAMDQVQVEWVRLNFNTGHARYPE